MRSAHNPFTLSKPAMYICICNGITERQIIQAAEHGARCGEDLERGLGVGVTCGCCRECASELLAEALSKMVESGAQKPAPAESLA